MQLTIQKTKKPDEKYCTSDLALTGGVPFTVRVDDHRILTLFTYSYTIAAKWTREILRGNRKSKKIIVGVTYERTPPDGPHSELITLCLGSHCLLVNLEGRDYGGPGTDTPLIRFFADPRVIVVGIDIKNVASKLFKEHKIKFANLMDLNEVTEEVMEDRHLYDYRRYDLDRLGTAVMGESWYVERPEDMEISYWWRDMEPDKAMWSTYDVYLCYTIGAKLMELKSKKKSGSAGKKSNMKKGTTEH